MAPREAPLDFTETYHVCLGIADLMKGLGGLVGSLCLLLLCFFFCFFFFF